MIDADFETAASLLDDTMREEYDANSLRLEYEEMTDYAESPAEKAEVITVLEEFPTLQDGDLGWAYVAIIGADWSEAVAGVVTKDEKIRDLELGRP